MFLHFKNYVSNVRNSNCRVLPSIYYYNIRSIRNYNRIDCRRMIEIFFNGSAVNKHSRHYIILFALCQN